MIMRFDAASLTFDDRGLIPAIAQDHRTGEVLMLAWMNEEAVARTLATGRVTYWSRSRQDFWVKGESSGHVQALVEMRLDCDQDAVWISVEIPGDASCHVGYRSCFYRAVPLAAESGKPLEFRESEKLFDPQKVYGDAPNPTIL